MEKCFVNWGMQYNTMTQNLCAIWPQHLPEGVQPDDINSTVDFLVPSTVQGQIDRKQSSAFWMFA